MREQYVINVGVGCDTGAATRVEVHPRVRALAAPVAPKDPVGRPDGVDRVLPHHLQGLSLPLDCWPLLAGLCGGTLYAIAILCGV